MQPTASLLILPAAPACYYYCLLLVPASTACCYYCLLYYCLLLLPAATACCYCQRSTQVTDAGAELSARRWPRNRASHQAEHLVEGGTLATA